MRRKLRIWEELLARYVIKLNVVDMKRLFLCSSFADVANLFVDCAKEDLQGKIIAFIPTASLTEPIRFYVKKGKKALEEAGMIVEEVEITQLPKEEISSILHKCDYIYITGAVSYTHLTLPTIA